MATLATTRLCTLETASYEIRLIHDFFFSSFQRQPRLAITGGAAAKSANPQVADDARNDIDHARAQEKKSA
jgi:hypothetical protein